MPVEHVFSEASIKLHQFTEIILGYCMLRIFTLVRIKETSYIEILI